MDEQQFDRLARTVGGQRTRREAMRWLGGSMAALAALFAERALTPRPRSGSVVPATTAANVALTVAVPSTALTTATTTMAHSIAAATKADSAERTTRTAAANWNVGTEAIAPMSPGSRGVPAVAAIPITVAPANRARVTNSAVPPRVPSFAPTTVSITTVRSTAVPTKGIVVAPTIIAAIPPVVSTAFVAITGPAPAMDCRWARAARTPASATERDTGSSASAASPCRGGPAA